MNNLKTALIELTRFIPQKRGEGILTSGEYASACGVSQQSASRYLLELEKTGLINRKLEGRRQKVSLTDEGMSVIESVHLQISGFLSKNSLDIKGSVTSGVGEGAYYVDKYSEKINKILGFTPYPGTLNIAVKKHPQLNSSLGKRIDGFSDGDRSFGYLDVIKAEIQFKDSKELCYLIQPERTHRRNQLEFISKDGLRKKLSLKDGDKAVVKII